MECRDRPPRTPLLSKVRELLPKAGVLTQGGKGDTEQRHPVSDFQQMKHLCQHVLRVNTAIPDRLPETKINGTASWKYAKEHMTGDMVLKKKKMGEVSTVNAVNHGKFPGGIKFSGRLRGDPAYWGSKTTSCLGS